MTRRIISPDTKEAPLTGSANNAVFFTIGHSTRSLVDFLALLRDANVTFVVDVRTVPRSRTNPQYDRVTLAQELASQKIGYEHIAELGGLRGKQRDVSTNANAFWQNKSFHNYADYAASESFRCGLARLRELGHRHTSAIMCAETLWWRCHRRIITDYLLAAHERVFHIVGPGQVTPAVVTYAAKPDGSGTLVYPAEGAISSSGATLVRW